MQQHRGAPSARDGVLADVIELHSTRTIDVKIGVKRVGGFGVLEGHIDLARNAFVPLGRCACPFADVNFVDPIPRNEHQSFDHAQTPWSRQIVHLNLAVFSVQSEHADLACPCDCICKRSIHRGVCFEGLRQVAASRFGQFFAIQRLHIQWGKQRKFSRCPLLNHFRSIE